MIPGRAPWMVKSELLATWNGILDLLRPQYPDCFIAGGAVRDGIYGLKARDVDVFTWLPLDESHRVSDKDKENPFSDDAIDFAANIPLEAGTKTSSRLADVGRYIAFDSQMKDEAEKLFMPEAIFQIVQVNTQTYEPGDVEGVVKQFGLSIQQAWYDGREVSATPAFLASYKSRTITVEYCESTHEMERLLCKVARFAGPWNAHKRKWNFTVAADMLHYLDVTIGE